MVARILGQARASGELAFNIEQPLDELIKLPNDRTGFAADSQRRSGCSL
jgi:hypothetical protein